MAQILQYLPVIVDPILLASCQGFLGPDQLPPKSVKRKKILFITVTSDNVAKRQLRNTQDRASLSELIRVLHSDFISS